MKRFRPIVLGADIVCVLTIALLCAATPAQAKQCHTERPSNAQSYWSYRLIDGRKCWYEGRPGFSKSLLRWPAAQNAQKSSRREPDTSAASKINPLDAQASISENADAQLKAKAETVDRGLESPPKATLTADDLRAWGNTKTSMLAEPVLTIMDRWPDQELQQHRTALASAAQSSSVNGGRTALMVVIVMMALSAVLMTTVRKARNRWRLPSWPRAAS